MADIKLKNKSGQEVIFNGISIVSVPKAAEEGYAEFTEDNKAVLFVEQTLSASEKAQARSNIDAVSSKFSTSEAGKFLAVGADGNVTTVEAPSGGYGWPDGYAHSAVNISSESEENA